MGFSKKQRTRLLALLREISSYAERDTSHNFVFAVRGRGITLDFDGYEVLARAANEIRDSAEWAGSYPQDFVINVIVGALVWTSSFEDALLQIERELTEGLSIFNAYVPLFGIRLDDDVRISFGPYQVRNLSDEDYNADLLGAVERGTSELPEELRHSVLDRFRKHAGEVRSLPVLIVPYRGSIEGARGIVAPIAGRICEFIQFCLALQVDRANVQIVEYRGAYEGRYMTVMPVVSAEGWYSLPNLRGNPYAPVLSQKDLLELSRLGILAFAEHLAEPVRAGHDIVALVQRSIQQVADAERAFSDRQAITSYVSACEVFFSRTLRTSAWVTAGMATSLASRGMPLQEARDLSKAIYEERSQVVHEGISPTRTLEARNVAVQCILEMIARRDQLDGRAAIRRWIEPYVDPAPEGCQAEA